jgi:hypothetical protein
MGPLGNGYLNLTGEQVFGRVPYPLLGVHLGNEARIYAPIAFNMMRFGEFASDRYASVQYRQNFEGLLLNRLPLIQKLKWRLLATANVLVGGISEANNSLVIREPDGKPRYLTYQLSAEKPYMELGYGIENIFKFLRIDVIHRLNYLEVPNSRPIGIFITAQLQL